MAQYKHISPEIVRWNFINLLIAFMVLIVYCAFLAAGYDFQANRKVLFGFLSALTLSIGWAFCWMCAAVLVENIRRKKHGDYQFVLLNKFSSAVSSSYFQSQLLMSVGFLTGLSLVMLGLYIFIMKFAAPFFGF